MRTRLQLIGKKTVHQQNRNRFQFYVRNPFKNYSETISEIMSQKYAATTVKLGTIFEKSRLRSGILKIHEVTSQVDQKLKPTRYMSGHFII